jgi:PAS domain S-box-containing protein
MKLPLRAHIFILALVAAGLTAIGLRVPEIWHWPWQDAATFAALAAAIAITEQFAVRYRYRTETWNFSLTDSLFVAGLIAARPSVLTLAVGAGTVIGHLVRWRNPYKMAFNVGQFVLSITAAQIVFASFPHHGALDASTWFAAMAAMAAFFVVNAASVAGVISLVEGRPFLSVLIPPMGLNVMHWAGNVAVGILGSVLWTNLRIGLPLLVVPLGLSYLAYRAWRHGMQERDRMQGLYEAGQSLIAPLGAAVDFRPFLISVQRMLDAPEAEVVLVEKDEVAVHDASGTLSLRVASSDDGTADRRPEAYVRVRPRLTPQLGLIGGPDEVRGVLAVYREQALSDSERSLLEALASQVAVRLQNVGLFFETVAQRTELEEILGHTSDGIFALSPDGTILSWNPAMERITAFTRPEVVGRPWDAVLGTPPPYEEALQQSRSPSDSRTRDVQLVRKDRVPRWVRFTWNAIPDREGHPRAYVVVARDVTTDVETEQLKTDFVATVSHELRTPLTPLKGFIASLLYGTVDDSPEARNEYYRIMMNQANRLERLITDLLDTSRIEAGTSLVDCSIVELNSLLAEHVREYGQQDPPRVVTLRPLESTLHVYADPFRLIQVVGNLLSNACKYSPPGSPVEVRAVATGRFTVVSVRDHGPGIAPADQERVFERFQRLEAGLTRQTGGTGLGLYIAKRLVEAMGGRLWLESGPDGTTFSFTVPMVAPRSPADEPGSATNGHRTALAREFAP